MPTRIINPFATEDQYTRFHHFVTDVIMPDLSGSAWKVLTAIIRKTLGWRKEVDQISYTQLMTATNINSTATIARALMELLDKNYILAELSSGQTTAIRLNQSYTVEWEEPTPPATPPFLVEVTPSEYEGVISQDATPSYYEGVTTSYYEGVPLHNMKTQKKLIKEIFKEPPAAPAVAAGGAPTPPPERARASHLKAIPKSEQLKTNAKEEEVSQEARAAYKRAQTLYGTIPKWCTLGWLDNRIKQFGVKQVLAALTITEELAGAGKGAGYILSILQRLDGEELNQFNEWGIRVKPKEKPNGNGNGGTYEHRRPSVGSNGGHANKGAGGGNAQPPTGDALDEYWRNYKLR